MAESIKEAEKEEKEGKSDLTSQIAKLEAESNPTKDSEVEHPSVDGDEQKKVVNA
jgi:hypothetical protein